MVKKNYYYGCLALIRRHIKLLMWLIHILVWFGTEEIVSPAHPSPL